MPRCVICNTRFYAQSWSAPVEPCDCGFEVSYEQWQEMPEEDYAAKSDDWHERCQQHEDARKSDRED